MPALSKLVIGSLDDLDLEVRAQYNPAQIDLSKHTTWKEHEGIQGRTRIDVDVLDFEYGGTGRTMKLELVFDQYEEGKSIQPKVTALQLLASPRNEDSTKDNDRRPHLCVVVWNVQGIPRFECVIETVDVKYSMFSADGLPLRATCTISLRESRIRDGFRRIR
jgi:hypothetical protein